MFKRLVIALAAVSALGLRSCPPRRRTSNATLADAMKDSQVPAMGILLIRDGKIAGEAQRGVRYIGGDPVQAGRSPGDIGSDRQGDDRRP